MNSSTSGKTFRKLLKYERTNLVEILYVNKKRKIFYQKLFIQIVLKIIYRHRYVIITSYIKLCPKFISGGKIVVLLLFIIGEKYIPTYINIYFFFFRITMYLPIIRNHIFWIIHLFYTSMNNGIF